MKAGGMDPIFLLAPTSTAERIARWPRASGYVYYVSLAGCDRQRPLNVDAVAERMPLIREKTGLPVGVGFGIRDAATAAAHRRSRRRRGGRQPDHRRNREIRATKSCVKPPAPM
jgi:tryptophan synthase alpha subunit